MYADRKVQDLEFVVGNQVLLKISPMKSVMRFGRRGKSSPRYIGPFGILNRVGDVAYELALPPGLAGVHPIFHEEPIAILDREVRRLRSKEIASVKVQRKHHFVEEAIWETESDMSSRYPQLFADSGKNGVSVVKKHCTEKKERKKKEAEEQKRANKR
ncbi:uncharacterized protein LOC132065236 [Lycium ferocissimum]|uniref:uncharacterized protein LOC132065236 n=1 Tax=Lycium ferocissimum TaxID=112874 RepID=UPI002814ED48|nr:uncharacterized protein LOC132065236 [Lycium ferocissimum]